MGTHVGFPVYVGVSIGWSGGLLQVLEGDEPGDVGLVPAWNQEWVNHERFLGWTGGELWGDGHPELCWG